MHVSVEVGEGQTCVSDTVLLGYATAYASTIVRVASPSLMFPREWLDFRAGGASVGVCALFTRTYHLLESYSGMSMVCGRGKG